MFLTQVTRALNAAKIPYALVGGYAVALHGAVRGTVDIDLILEISLKTFKKVELVFNQIGLESRLPIKAEDVFYFRKEYVEKRNLIAWSFVDPRNPVRIVDIIITLDLSDVSRIKKSISGHPVFIISIEDLIKMKKASGRPQDLSDVSALEVIEKKAGKRK